MSEFLVTYLDSIDERLSTTSTRTRNCAQRWSSACATTPRPSWKAPSRPAAVAEDWADWFDLARAFVAAYAPEGVEELEEAASLMSDEVGETPCSARRTVSTWPPSSRSSTPTPRCGSGSSSLGGKGLVHGVGEVGVGEVQVAGRGGDVGMAEEALDDVDVDARGATGSWHRSGASGGGSGDRRPRPRSRQP